MTQLLSLTGSEVIAALVLVIAWCIAYWLQVITLTILQLSKLILQQNNLFIGQKG